MCRAGIHAGAITNEGGVMYIEKVKGLPNHEESTNNGVKTNKFGSTTESFKVLKEFIKAPSDPSERPSPWESAEKSESEESTETPDILNPTKGTKPSYPTQEGQQSKQGQEKPKKPPGSFYFLKDIKMLLTAKTMTSFHTKSDC